MIHSCKPLVIIIEVEMVNSPSSHQLRLNSQQLHSTSVGNNLQQRVMHQGKTKNNDTCLSLFVFFIHPSHIHPSLHILLLNFYLSDSVSQHKFIAILSSFCHPGFTDPRPLAPTIK
ncbi:hypothetical protein L2E82_13019 [Cichorium intybus]|uniref:Uncharacterized protein n=1 Tax=Cichorium intybus TaxID=13427 RepID=A0ACB9GIS8_CICIN|nr:hypothetical protein L2E82_13019 [Cichorium intybus]